MNETKRLLIVDDDSDDRDFFREAVAELSPGMLCLEAIDGADALKLLQVDSQSRPDYIFLDLNMPRMCGKTFLKEVKKDFLLKDIPIFVFSTSSDPQDKNDSLRLGAISFFIKPCCFEELRQKIISAFSLIPS